MVWRRRQSVVNARQQMWFGLELVFVAIGFVILCIFFLFVPPMSDIFTAPDPAGEVLAALGRTVAIKWPLIMVSMMVLWCIGILISHRLAGPLFALERVVKRWAKGDRTGRVYFRRYDYLLPVKASLNHFFETEAERIRKVEALAKEIESQCSSEEVKKKATEIVSILQPDEESA